MKIIGINIECESNYDDFVETKMYRQESILGYDSIIINTDFLLKGYNKDGESNGVEIIHSRFKNIVNNDFAQLKNELNTVLNKGKTVYVILGTNKDCCFRYSVNKFSTFLSYSFLPFEVKITHSRGRHIDITNSKSVYAKMLEDEDDFKYKAHIEVATGISFAKVSGSDHVVATEVKHGSGKVVFLPCFFNESSKTNYIDNLVEKIIAFEKNKPTVADTLILPQWTENYLLPAEQEVKQAIKTLEIEQDRILAEIEKKKTDILNIQKFKTMFATSGTTLENIVSEILERIGFVLLPTEPNRTDIIAQYNDNPVVIEIKGLTKSAGEKNSAQLEKWASDYLENNSKEAKPILIINGWNELPLLERKEAVFPNQMLNYAKNRNHCLITSIQLLCMYYYIVENPNEKDNVIHDFLNTVGIYKKFEDYKDYISVIESETSEQVLSNKNIEETPK